MSLLGLGSWPSFSGGKIIESMGSCDLVSLGIYPFSGHFFVPVSQEWDLSVSHKKDSEVIKRKKQRLPDFSSYNTDSTTYAIPPIPFSLYKLYSMPPIICITYTLYHLQLVPATAYTTNALYHL